MKALPFLTFILYLHDVICQETEVNLYKPLLKFPKKTKPSAKKNEQILLSKKFLNFKPAPLKSMTTISSNGYTAFSAVGLSEQKFYDVPDSPYFPTGQKDYQKVRVKKTLSSMPLLRKKRSAGISEKAKNQSNTKVTKKGAKLEKGHNKALRGHGDNSKQNRKDKNIKRKRIKLIDRHGNYSVRHSLDDTIKKKKSNLKRTFKGSKLRMRDIKNQRPAKRAKSNSTKRVKKLRKGRKQLNTTNVKSVTAKEKDSRRLIAARDAMIEDYPYMVSIQKNNEHWCSGALLNPRLVITTANCVWKSNQVSRMKVRAGSRHADRGGQLVKIQEVMKHPNWSIRQNPDNDVALLLLEQRIKFSNKVHGVDLPNRSMMPPFEDAWITSWGSERRDGVIDRKSISLQVIHARLLDRDKCNNVTHRFGVHVTPNFICLSQSGKRAPCTRDTGAPAVSDGVLWGLASWGIRRLCGTERFPSMFSYLGSHTNMDFISNATRYLMSDERFYPSLDRFVPGIEPTTTATTIDKSFQINMK